MAVVNVRYATVAAMIALSQNPIATRTASATTRPRMSGDELIRSRPGAFFWENERSRSHQSLKAAGTVSFGLGAGAGDGATPAGLAVDRRRTSGSPALSRQRLPLPPGDSSLRASSQSSRSSNDSPRFRECACSGAAVPARPGNPGFRIQRDHRRGHDLRPALLTSAPCALASVLFFGNLQEKHPALPHRDFIALVDRAARHLVAVDEHELGVRRCFDLESLPLPADPPVNRPDSRPLEYDVACRTRSEKDGMIASQLDELNATLTIVNFESCHIAYRNVSWATTSKS